MSVERDYATLVSLVRELQRLPSETEWVEFKHNNTDPKEIGAYISALSNSAALLEKPNAYIVWGIDDKTHAIVGTNFRPSAKKIGNEELENWLLHLLDPGVYFQFFEIDVDGYRTILLEIESATRQPVRFSGEAFIRVGSYKKKLKDHPERERTLWRLSEQIPFEKDVAVQRVSGQEIVELLDTSEYFRLLDRPRPQQLDSVLSTLESDGMIERENTGRWSILNLGAILLARRLRDFDSLARKSVRVIVYRGTGRLNAIREQEGTMGYATGFEGLITYIKNLLPANEVIEQSLRKNVTMYPEPAIRELVANALIHQDFSITGAGPMVEIFDDRLEVSNPGAPLVDTMRFLDTPPRSRNETLASFMRRAGVCEERGSGVDKVVSEAEFYQLPAPVFETPLDNTRAVLFSHRPMSKMDKEDRIRACYLHACLRYVMREDMTNATLRKRFGVEQRNAAKVSKIIKDTLAAGLIRPFDDSVGTRALRYVPFWG